MDRSGTGRRSIIALVLSLLPHLACAGAEDWRGLFGADEPPSPPARDNFGQGLRTIEWLVANAEMIVCGTVEAAGFDELAPVKDPDDESSSNVVVRITEVLKGNRQVQIAFDLESPACCHRPPESFPLFQDARSSVRIGDRVLVLLRRLGPARAWFLRSPDPKDYTCAVRLEYGSYTDQLPSFLWKDEREQWRATLVVPLSLDRVLPVHTADFESLGHSGQILDRVRQLAREAEGKPSPDPVLIESPAWARAEGLPPYMEAAADDAMEQRAWMWAMSDDPVLRRNAASVLGSYQSFGSRHFVERLKRLGIEPRNVTVRQPHE